MDREREREREHDNPVHVRDTCVWGFAASRYVLLDAGNYSISSANSNDNSSNNNSNTTATTTTNNNHINNTTTNHINTNTITTMFLQYTIKLNGLFNLFQVPVPVVWKLFTQPHLFIHAYISTNNYLQYLIKHRYTVS